MCLLHRQRYGEGMDNGTISYWIMTGTVLTGVATLILAIVAIWAGIVALRELKLANRKYLLADLERNRELTKSTFTELTKFMKLYDIQHPIILKAMRDLASELESNPVVGQIIPHEIPDLFTESRLSEGTTPEHALKALQACLDSLELIALGVEKKHYDFDTVCSSNRGQILQLVEWSQNLISLLQSGELRNRAQQPDAYCSLLRLAERLRTI